jgi:hypothetical protein
MPVGFYVDQIVGDDTHRCFTTDLSALGIFVERVVDEPLRRSSNIVQLEIPLPEAGETLWAKGEVIYDRFDALFHGSAIRFAGMARMHQRLLRDWLWESRKDEQRALRGGAPQVVTVRRPNALDAPRTGLRTARSVRLSCMPFRRVELRAS